MSEAHGQPNYRLKLGALFFYDSETLGLSNSRYPMRMSWLSLSCVSAEVERVLAYFLETHCRYKALCEFQDCKP